MHDSQASSTRAARRAALHAAGRVALGVTSAAAALLAGCASVPGIEPPRVSVVGVERLPGEGMELRLALRLRVQNLSSVSLRFDGLALELDVNGQRLATGVLAEEGTVPRYGEVLLTVPVSISATAAARQLLVLMQGPADGPSARELPYALRGRLSGGPLPGMSWVGSGMSFTAQGSLKLPR
ncbi:MAG: hypothetical protein RI988_3081 [Pseudomonadota bacterium]|jgi:hypothetical protein